MRRFIALLVAVLFIAGTAYAINPVSPGTGDLVGQGKAPWEPHKTFRLVRVITGLNYSGAINTDPVNYTVSNQFVMIWWTGTSGSDGVTVAPCARVSYDSRVAGVLVTDVNISEDNETFQYVTNDYGKENWGYLQTYGLAYVNIGAAVSAGDLLGCAYTTGDAAPFIAQQATATTTKENEGVLNPAQQGILGIALDADAGYTAGDEVRVFIKCE